MHTLSNLYTKDIFELKCLKNEKGKKETTLMMHLYVEINKSER